MLSIVETLFAITAVIICVISAFFLTKKLNDLSTKNLTLQKQVVDKLKETRLEQNDINEFTKEYCDFTFDISNTKELNDIFDEMDVTMDKINSKLTSVYQVCLRERKDPINTRKNKKKRFRK